MNNNGSIFEDSFEDEKVDLGLLKFMLFTHELSGGYMLVRRGGQPKDESIVQDTRHPPLIAARAPAAAAGCFFPKP